MSLLDKRSNSNFMRRNSFWSPLPIFVTTAMDTEYATQFENAIALFESFDYREFFRESDIKRAVAFFMISLCSSSSAIRFLSSRISICSGVSGAALGVIPCLSCLRALLRNSFSNLSSPI